MITSTSIYSACTCLCSEIASENGSPRSREAAMIQNKPFKTGKTKLLPCGLGKHQGLPFPVFFQPLLLGLKEKQLCLFNPALFCCNVKGLRKVVVLQIKGVQTTTLFLNETVLQGQKKDTAKQMMF